MRSPDAGTPAPERRWLGWKTNAVLLVLTVASVFGTSFVYRDPGDSTRLAVVHAVQFTCTLLAILLAHELAHYVAARAHGVEASLPYFVPLPILSPFGTMGAVIAMPDAIPSRRALLDFGAAGPLAGLALALPLYAWGVAHSTIVPLAGAGVELGDSLLLRGLDHLFGPATPAGTTVLLSPVAEGAWAGLFVTMINLLPAGQLDGGHVAYALLGPRQDRVASWVHRSMLAFFAVSVASFVARDLQAGAHLWHLGRHVQSSLFWLVWFEVIAIIGQLTTPDEPDERARLGASTRAIMTALLLGTAWLLLDHDSFFLWAALLVALVLLVTMEIRWGALRRGSRLVDHPATGDAPLSWGRAAIAVITLAFFALLFMPTPFVF